MSDGTPCLMPAWFQLGTQVFYRAGGNRRMTIVRIDEEKFRFHTVEPGVDKWLAFRWLDWTQFELVPTVWDHIVKD